MRLSKKIAAQEKSLLDRVAVTYLDHGVTERKTRDYIVKTFQPFIKPDGSGLELGCSDGYMTAKLARIVKRLTVVDGSKKFFTQAKLRKVLHTKYVYSLFEEFETDDKFDYVFASYIFEHVLDPMKVLQAVKSVLKKDGLLLAVVPNAKSLSRQIALRAGFIDDLYGMSVDDRKHGHRRIYDQQTFSKDLARGGFKIIAHGGLMLKPFSDRHLDKLLSEKIIGQRQLEALYQLGLENPDWAGSLFVVCRVK